MKRTLASAAAALLIAAACGGDDDDATPAATDDAQAAEPAGEEAVDPGAAVSEAADSNDLTAQILDRFFGLPADFASAEQRACVNAELAPRFPGGVLPDDAVLDDELGDALDAAAEACGLEVGG